MTPADIKALMQDLNLRPYELAAKLHTSKVTVYRWMKGIHKPQPYFVRAMQALRK